MPNQTKRRKSYTENDEHRINIAMKWKRVTVIMRNNRKKSDEQMVDEGAT